MEQPTNAGDVVVTRPDCASVERKRWQLVRAWSRVGGNEQPTVTGAIYVEVRDYDYDAADTCVT